MFTPFHKLPYTYPYGRSVDETMTRRFLSIAADGADGLLSSEYFLVEQGLDRSHAKKRTSDRAWFRQTKSWASDWTPPKD
jgi:hypothetical protein